MGHSIIEIDMNQITQVIINEYVQIIREIFGAHLKKVILYGSYARGDYKSDSDIDILILVDLGDLEIKKLGRLLSDATFDINLENDIDIKPIAKNESHFNRWITNYPFYKNVSNDGVILYDVA